jgi:hypothetical protein
VACRRRDCIRRSCSLYTSEISRRLTPCIAGCQVGAHGLRRRILSINELLTSPHLAPPPSSRHPSVSAEALGSSRFVSSNRNGSGEYGVSVIRISLLDAAVCRSACEIRSLLHAVHIHCLNHFGCQLAVVLIYHKLNYVLSILDWPLEIILGR